MSASFPKFEPNYISIKASNSNNEPQKDHFDSNDTKKNSC